MRNLVLMVTMLFGASAMAEQSAWEKHIKKKDEQAAAVDIRKKLAVDSAALIMSRVPIQVDQFHSLKEATPDGEGVVLRFSTSALSMSDFEKPDSGPEKAFVDTYRREAIEGFEKQYCGGDLVSYYPRVGMHVTFILEFMDGQEMMRLKLVPNDCHRIIDRIESQMAVTPQS